MSPINQHSTAPCFSFLTSNGRWRWRLANHQQWWSRFFQSMELFSSSLEQFRRMKSTVLTVISFLAGSIGFIFCQHSWNHGDSFGLHLNMVKQWSEVVMWFGFCSLVSLRGTHCIHSFLILILIFRVECFVCFNWDVYSVSNLSDFHLSICKQDQGSWILLTMSFVVN